MRLTAYTRGILALPVLKNGSHQAEGGEDVNSSDQLEQKLVEYLNLYNHHIVQKNLGHISPVAKLKEWQKTHPELFVKKVYNQSRPDTGGGAKQ
jgi:hypothetical protein